MFFLCHKAVMEKVMRGGSVLILLKTNFKNLKLILFTWHQFMNFQMYHICSLILKPLITHGLFAHRCFKLVSLMRCSLSTVWVCTAWLTSPSVSLISPVMAGWSHLYYSYKEAEYRLKIFELLPVLLHPSLLLIVLSH